MINGHGGGCVATYAAKVLLPHIAASLSPQIRNLNRGVCNTKATAGRKALDLDGLIRSSDRSKVGKSREAGIDVVNPNSIFYRSPYEDSESEGITAWTLITERPSRSWGPSCRPTNTTTTAF